MSLLILTPLLLLLVAEYVGDFLLQDRETALNKSKSFKYLGQHLFAIFCCIAATGLGLGMSAVYLAGCYVIIHGIQDWFIWKGYAWLIKMRHSCKTKDGKIFTDHERIELYVKNKEYAEDKVFYDTIGLDRLLHIITLIVLWGVFFL